MKKLPTTKAFVNCFKEHNLVPTYGASYASVESLRNDKCCALPVIFALTSPELLDVKTGELYTWFNKEFGIDSCNIWDTFDSLMMDRPLKITDSLRYEKTIRKVTIYYKALKREKLI